MCDPPISPCPPFHSSLSIARARIPCRRSVGAPPLPVARMARWVRMASLGAPTGYAEARMRMLATKKKLRWQFCVMDKTHPYQRQHGMVCYYKNKGVIPGGDLLFWRLRFCWAIS